MPSKDMGIVKNLFFVKVLHNRWTDIASTCQFFFKFGMMRLSAHLYCKGNEERK